jgi:hypothetical protein
MDSADNRPIIPVVPHISLDPRHIAITSKIDALSERAGAIHDEIAATKYNQAAAQSGDRARWLARELANDPTSTPPPDVDHDRVLAQLQEQVVAVGEAKNLLEREKKDVELKISKEIVERLRPDYLVLLVAIHEKAQALLEAIEREEAFAAQLVGAGLDLRSFHRITLALTREDVENLKREARHRYNLDLGQGESSRPGTSGARHGAPAVAVEQADSVR